MALLPCQHTSVTYGCATCKEVAATLTRKERLSAIALLMSLEPPPPADEARIATMSQIKDVYAEGFECAKTLYRVEAFVQERDGLLGRLASANVAIRTVATSHHMHHHDKSVAFVDCPTRSCVAAREAMGDDA